MSYVAGTLCIFDEDKTLQCLILQRHNGSWDLPKGIVEKYESMHDAALRETREETSLEPSLTDKHTIGKIGSDTVWIFEAKTSNRNVSLSDEHINFTWVTPQKAMSMLYPPLAKIAAKLLPASIGGQVDTEKRGLQ